VNHNQKTSRRTLGSSAFDETLAATKKESDAVLNQGTRRTNPERFGGWLHAFNPQSKLPINGKKRERFTASGEKINTPTIKTLLLSTLKFNTSTTSRRKFVHTRKVILAMPEQTMLTGSWQPLRLVTIFIFFYLKKDREHLETNLFVRLPPSVETPHFNRIYNHSTWACAAVG
jgi:hypothetical protein